MTHHIPRRYDLASFLLNESWLRHDIISRTAPCLAAWNDGPRAAGVLAAVTEAAAMCGSTGIQPGAPTTSSFIHGFFSIAQLGQFAREGVALLARWGIPQLLGLDFRSASKQDPLPPPHMPGGAGVPHQCPLESVPSFLCQFMLTCDIPMPTYSNDRPRPAPPGTQPLSLQTCSSTFSTTEPLVAACWM